MPVWSLGWEDPLETEMATCSSILAWEIWRTEEPGGLQSMGSQRTGHDWAGMHTQVILRNKHQYFTNSGNVQRHFVQKFYGLYFKGSHIQLPSHMTVSIWKEKRFIINKLRIPNKCRESRLARFVTHILNMTLRKNRSDMTCNQRC